MVAACNDRFPPNRWAGACCAFVRYSQLNRFRQRKEIFTLSLNLKGMATETRNQNTMNLDIMTPLEVVTAMNNEDKKGPEAISTQLPQIAKCVEWAIESLNNGGRLIYMGAGTSGRLAVVDASECPPTFGVSPDLVVGLIAGGEKAFIKAVEGAEDSRELGENDLKNLNLNSNDIVVGIAASGRTPYVLGGLAYANSLGCHTVGISCNSNTAISAAAKLAIEVVCGPEALTGSTRLKSGTAQKLVLNMISTGTMVGIGKAYQNLMVDVQQTNEKLVVRAQNICMEATGCEREVAKEKIELAGGHVKTAIVMILADCGLEEAKARLEKSKGHVRGAIQ